MGEPGESPKVVVGSYVVECGRSVAKADPPAERRNLESAQTQPLPPYEEPGAEAGKLGATNGVSEA